MHYPGTYINDPTMIYEKFMESDITRVVLTYEMLNFVLLVYRGKLTQMKSFFSYKLRITQEC